MQFKTRITQEDYVSLMFTLSYRKIYSKIIIGLGILMILLALAYFISPSSKIMADAGAAWQDLVIGSFFIFGMPLLLYFWSKKTYKSLRRLHGDVTYEFTSEGMVLSGSSFNSEQKWNGTFKIDELKKWFLIYQSRQSANLIPKKDLTPGQIEELRRLFRTLKGIKVRLK